MSKSFNIYRKRGSGTLKKGYLVVGRDGKQVPAHVVKVEGIIGRKLPDGAEVHHIDEDRLNNTNSNLVVCPSHDYHMLLHVRQRAYDASGHADWRRCSICKNYDDPKNMKPDRPKVKVFMYRHTACIAAYNRALRGRA